MVRLNRIYTKTGDTGTTALASGERRNKHDVRVESYGMVDELNAAVGLARAFCEEAADSAPDSAILARIQNDLFDLGADLARPLAPSERETEVLRVVEEQVLWLEAMIDEATAQLAPLTSFVLPGGSKAGAGLHGARTVCRRAERTLWRLMEAEPGTVNPCAARYLNRLSDYFFVAARLANDRGRADVLWVPGGGRGSTSA